MIDTNKGNKNSIWQSFGLLFVLSIVISALLFFLFWYFLGTIRVKTINVDNIRQYSQDMLSVAGSIFTVIGYFLTIFQLWKLRTEQETVAKTKAEIEQEIFKITTFRDIDKARNILQDLFGIIEKEDSFDKKVLSGYIDKLHTVNNILTEIDANKHAIDGSVVCKNCQELINSCITSFSNVIKERTIEEIDKITHKKDINSIIQELIRVNSQIRN
jgi:hypothetical protein